MNVQEATNRLAEVHLTSSAEVVRRWIRQGKINATKESKRSGYKIDSDELEKFIAKKLLIMNNESLDYDRGFQDGYELAKIEINKKNKY